MAIDVTEASFGQEVIERSRQLPVVVDFWAEWCGPCRQLSPALEAAESKRDGEVVLAKVDTDANQALAQRYGIQGIPAVKAFRDGEIVDEFVGAVPPARSSARGSSRRAGSPPCRRRGSPPARPRAGRAPRGAD